MYQPVINIGAQKNHRLGFLVYVFTFGFSLLSIYVANWAAPILNVFILLASYWLIIFKNKFYPVLFLIIFSRCINGFVVHGDIAAYSLFNFLTGYLPLALYLARNFFRTPRKHANRFVLREYPFSIVYTLLLVAYMMPDLALSSQLFFSRVAPMLMLLLSLLVARNRIEWPKLMFFLRIIFIFALIAFATPDYLETSYGLMEDGTVFSKEVVGQSIELFETPRLMGVFWDFRIQGLFAVLLLSGALLRGRYRWRRVDMALSVVVLLLTISRGSIILGLLITFCAVVYYNRSILKAYVLVGLVVAAFGLLFLFFFDSVTTDLLSSFNIFSSSNNALSQRSGFRDYAIDKFIEQPLGGGIGSLKADGVIRNIYVGGEIFQNASDAFHFILLAEIGIFGYIFFILSFIEILHRRNMFSAGLIAGLLIVMLGTDVPDMGVFYFCLMFLFSGMLDNLPRKSVLPVEQGVRS